MSAAPNPRARTNATKKFLLIAASTLVKTCALTFRFCRAVRAAQLQARRVGQQPAVRRLAQASMQGRRGMREASSFAQCDGLTRSQVNTFLLSTGRRMTR